MEPGISVPRSTGWGATVVLMSLALCGTAVGIGALFPNFGTGSTSLRRDDNPEVFKTRLEVYRAQTAPVTEYYRSQGLLNTVDGLQPIDGVTEQLTAVLAAFPSHQIRSDVR